MSNYCFSENEGRRALFAEVFARALVAAMCDFPRYSSPEEAGEQSFTAAKTLLPEVCCKPSVEEYLRLVSYCWVVRISQQ